MITAVILQISVQSKGSSSFSNLILWCDSRCHFWNLWLEFVSSVQFGHSVMSDFLWTAARQASLSITSSRNLLKVMSIESVMLSDHLILCRALLLLPSTFPSISIFSNESVFRIRWPKYQSFSFSISPFNEYSGLISFRIEWFNLVVQEKVQGKPKKKPKLFLQLYQKILDLKYTVSCIFTPKSC